MFIYECARTRGLQKCFIQVNGVQDNVSKNSEWKMVVLISKVIRLSYDDLKSKSFKMDANCNRLKSRKLIVPSKHLK